MLKPRWMKQHDVIILTDTGFIDEHYQETKTSACCYFTFAGVDKPQNDASIFKENAISQGSVFMITFKFHQVVGGYDPPYSKNARVHTYRPIKFDHRRYVPGGLSRFFLRVSSTITTTAATTTDGHREIDAQEPPDTRSRSLCSVW